MGGPKPDGLGLGRVGHNLVRSSGDEYMRSDGQSNKRRTEQNLVVGGATSRGLISPGAKNCTEKTRTAG